MLKKLDTAQLSDEEIRRSFARCFNNREGLIVLSHLRRLTLERYLGPDISSDALRHLEGQRYLVGYICSLAEVDL